MCGISKSNIQKIQRVQNKAVKFITKGDPDQPNLEEAHIKYKLEAINVRYHKRSVKTWQKLNQDDEELVNQTIEAKFDNRRDHYWWRRIGGCIHDAEPDPVYT